MGYHLMTNKFRGEVAAAEFGDGFTIRLDMEGQGKLETEYGEFDFAHKVQFGLAVLSSKYLRSARMAISSGLFRKCLSRST